MSEDEHADQSAARLRRFIRGELPEEDVAALEEELERSPELRDRLDELARALATSPDGRARRIEDPTRTLRPTVVLRSPGAEPALDAIGSGAARLELGELIGQGGMGVVYEAVQTSLDRMVAVKQVKLPASANRVRLLLEEAWVTGELEHPNIVPIHDIQKTKDGAPQVILKRIEGSVWSELLRDPREVRRQFETEDPLEWHLRVLLCVCQALRFAHSRGIIHRDVKPSNVMIGRFGEVYLLDWGLAVRVTDEHGQGDPDAMMFGAGGTPSYMAPEQIDGKLDRLSPRTDVYLVGAVLFEIITGRAPHPGASLDEVLDEALAGPPSLPDGQPADLVAIVQRALEPEPERRFASVQDLRLAIEAFLEHRASRALARAAAVSAARVEAASQRADGREVERAFVEAAFGYRAALDAWPDNAGAKRALLALVVERIEGALRDGAVATAERLIALYDVPAALRARVSLAAQALELRERNLAQLERDHDRSVGHRPRRSMIAVFVGGWAAWWVFVALRFPLPGSTIAIGPATLGAASVIAGLSGRRAMLSNRLNRHISWIIFATLLATVSWLFGGELMELSERLIPVPLFLIWALGTGTGALTIDRRSLPSAAAYLTAFFVTAVDPTLCPIALIATNMFWLFNALVVNVLVGRSARNAAA